MIDLTVRTEFAKLCGRYCLQIESYKYAASRFWQKKYIQSPQASQNMLEVKHRMKFFWYQLIHVFQKIVREYARKFEGNCSGDLVGNRLGWSHLRRLVKLELGWLLEYARMAQRQKQGKDIRPFVHCWEHVQGLRSCTNCVQGWDGNMISLHFRTGTNGMAGTTTLVTCLSLKIFNIFLDGEQKESRPDRWMGTKAVWKRLWKPLEGIWILSHMNQERLNQCSSLHFAKQGMLLFWIPIKWFPFSCYMMSPLSWQWLVYTLVSSMISLWTLNKMDCIFCILVTPVPSASSLKWQDLSKLFFK